MKRAGSSSEPSRETQATDLPSVDRSSAHSPSKVVLPKPAGAETSVSLRSSAAARLSRRRGRATRLGRVLGARSLVVTSVWGTTIGLARFFPDRSLLRREIVSHGPLYRSGVPTGDGSPPPVPPFGRWGSTRPLGTVIPGVSVLDERILGILRAGARAVSSILAKLGADNRTEAVAVAAMRGLIRMLG